MAIACGIVFSLLCTAFSGPLLALLGADETTAQATAGYMKWTVEFGAVPGNSECGQWLIWCARRARPCTRSIGTMSGCLLNIALDPVFILPWVLTMGARRRADWRRFFPIAWLACTSLLCWR